MGSNLKLDGSHTKFLFDSENNLNIFNIARLLRFEGYGDDIGIDVCDMSSHHQTSIVSKFSAFLSIYSTILGKDSLCASLTYSEVDQTLIEIIKEKQGFEQVDKILLFDINSDFFQQDPKDPHFVKNVRGAVLLSLVQDLLTIGSVKGALSIFDKNSPILLHSASDFLHNQENAKIMWQVLEGWENKHEDQLKADINRRINHSSRVRRKLQESCRQAERKLSDNSNLDYIVGVLQSKVKFPNDVYILTDKLILWFVDDQHANGWFKLIDSIIPNSIFDIKTMDGKESVNMQLQLATKIDIKQTPDLALVDLRLSGHDKLIEDYNAQDLSGFEVVDLLLNKWPGLSVMIASASSKLWNMEKAIEKGAIAYWRKSDEVTHSENICSILTAFDIYDQFIDKFGIALVRSRYKYIYRIVEAIRNSVQPLGPIHGFLHMSIENYFQDLEQKTSWMCWQKTNETRINDSIFLGVMEIFNELENVLWDPENEYLKLVPGKKVQKKSERSDSQIINDTLEHLDQKYGIGGYGLSSYYRHYKSIRNRLSIIHGSEQASNIRHATISDIESSLLIVWCLLYELNISRN